MARKGSASPSARKRKAQDEPEVVKSPAATKKTPEKKEVIKSPKPVKKTSSHSEEKEFGGVPGNLGLMVFSHVILYYVYYILFLQDGPQAGALKFSFTKDELVNLWQHVQPTWMAFYIYAGFIFAQAFLAYVTPGYVLFGPKDDKGEKQEYNCNCYGAWWTSIAVLFGLHYYKVWGFSLSLVYDNFGGVMTIAILWADIQSLLMYVWAFIANATHRMTGNHIYDFFMGAMLHPRIPFPLLSRIPLDIKMFAEVRLSWFLLFLLTSSAAAKQYELTGGVTMSMWFMMLAHFLYANACAKGETFIVSTWDIVYEKYGWMLCFWNFAGVPFLYCAQSMYIVRHTPSPTLPEWAWVLMFQTLLFAYWIWDTCGSQKNDFRLKSAGVHVRRWTFPQLPWQYIENPRVLHTKCGSPLLIDGWYRYARKIHYTCDVVFAITWGLSCGFDCFIPYFYAVFFTGMIIHRYLRDVAKTSAKYGDDWIEYCKTVKYIFIPGVF